MGYEIRALSKSEIHSITRNQDVSIAEAMMCLEASGLQIVLGVNDGNQLTGICTDGDIRRAILSGISLGEKIAVIMNSKPMVTRETVMKPVMEFLKSNIKHLPVVDENNLVQGVWVLDYLKQNVRRQERFVIMAGGRGTRLGQLTDNCPKPMLNVGGKPVLQHIITAAKNSGFHRFVISINYLGGIIEEYFGDGFEQGIEVKYIREEEPLGTGGSLRSLQLEKNENIIVTNGDVISDVNYGKMLDSHVGAARALTMAVREESWTIPYGTVEIENEKISRYVEKPIVPFRVNAGIYAMNSTAFKYMPKPKRWDMPDLLHNLIENSLEIGAYVIFEKWLDIGAPEDLKSAQTMSFGRTSD